jgi:hypothetical protein
MKKIKYIPKLYYVINYIIVKIHNNYNFLIRRMDKVDVKKSNRQIFGDGGSTTSLSSRRRQRRFLYRTMLVPFCRGGFLLICWVGFFFFATIRQSKESFSLHGFAIYPWSKSRLMKASKSLSFDSRKKVIEGKTNDSFILSEKIMRCNLKTCRMRY